MPQTKISTNTTKHSSGTSLTVSGGSGVTIPNHVGPIQLPNPNNNPLLINPNSILAPQNFGVMSFSTPNPRSVQLLIAGQAGKVEFDEFIIKENEDGKTITLKYDIFNSARTFSYGDKIDFIHVFRTQDDKSEYMYTLKDCKVTEVEFNATSSGAGVLILSNTQGPFQTVQLEFDQKEQDEEAEKLYNTVLT